jgi:hypothetical protein
VSLSLSLSLPALNHEYMNKYMYIKVLLYLMPINIGFGVVGGFLYTYFYGETVSVYRGDSAVGFVSAMASAFCSISVLPLTAVTILVGKVINSIRERQTERKEGREGREGGFIFYSLSNCTLFGK